MRNWKRKLDVYFDVDGCIESQVWFYGTIGILGFSTLSMMVTSLFF